MFLSSPQREESARALAMIADNMEADNIEEVAGLRDTLIPCRLT